METDDLIDKWGLESFPTLQFAFLINSFDMLVYVVSHSSVYVVTEFLYEILAD